MKDLSLEQEALIKNNFRQMYYDIGMSASIDVLFEIIQTANVLAEILTDEQRILNEKKED